MDLLERFFQEFSEVKIAYICGDREFRGRFVYVSALRLDDGELLVVISPDSSQTAIADYGHHWGIETLFGMFKTRGFCLESTHFIHSERLSKLIALMALAMCRGTESRTMVTLSYTD